MTGFTVRPGDIIVSCAGTIGETYLLPPEAPIGIINQALMRAKLHLDSIIPYWLLHFQYILLIENKLKGSGSAIKNIPPFEVLKAMPVPLPPLAEQKRIVAKIEELLPKVDEYGKAQEKLNKLNEELPERLKKSILQEAIEGRLVPQDPNDEPASALLAKIREERKQLVKEGKLKKKDLEEKPISEDEIPFEIPESWEWCRVSLTGDVITGGTPSKTESKYYGNDYPFYKPADLEQGINTINSVDSLSVEGFNHSRKLPEDSILVTCIGSIGKTGLIRKEGACNQQINAIIPNKRLFVPEYLYYYILSPVFQETMQENSSSTTLSILNKNKFSQLLLALPPLAEQKRIVERIEQLFKEIDKLKK
jgi:type I restriction enzyme S subunit